MVIVRIWASLCVIALPLFFLSAAFGAEISIARSARGTSFVAIDGEIEPTDGQKFERLTADLAPGTIVTFRSPGGALRAGLAIGASIRTKGFATLALPEVRCASACALAWLAGTPRLMQPNSRIGFHAAYVKQVDGQARETGVGNALVGAYLTMLDLPISAVEYITSPAPQEIRWLSISDAMAIGINVVVPPKPQPKTSGPAQEDNETEREIRRAVTNLETEYRKSGITGLRKSVEICYARFAEKSEIRLVRYCFALDSTAMRLDQAMMSIVRKPPDAYFSEERVMTRANWAFDRLGANQAARGQLTSYWTRIAQQAFIELTK